MELWMDLLFGNLIGIFSMVTIGLAFIIPIVMWWKFASLSKSQEK